MSEYVQQWHLDRGSAVHAACQMIVKGTLDWEALDGRIRPFCEAFRFFVYLQPGIEVVESERKVCHPSGRFSGRLDLVLRQAGNPRLIVTDIKLGAVGERYWLQDACYAQCYAPNGYAEIDRGLLALKYNGMPDFRLDDRAAEHDAAWLALVDRYEREVEGA